MNEPMGRARQILIWLFVGLLVLIPLLLAASSPLLQWREPVYIIAGFAGIIGLTILLIQPLLIVGFLPGISVLNSRKTHRWIGGFLVCAVIIHVGGLWLTSPPDVIDALTFRSPTPFSVWGVIAMWMVFATAIIAAFRRTLRIRPKTWRLTHVTLVSIIVAGTIIHTLLIEGTMETYSKILLCIFVILALFKVVVKVRGA